MIERTRLAWVLLWVTSLVIVGTWVRAQSAPAAPAVISGADLGFRPEGWNGAARTGTFVVRINGEWVEAQARVKPVRSTQ
ncbi:MAG: hypothetical protein U0Q12_22460 [Vicinamibacterales bacterium]